MSLPHFALLICLLLSACYSGQRITEIGSAPAMTPTQDPRAHQNYHPVRMPMPKEYRYTYPANSLWRIGARGFFKDQRASKVGDLITVIISTKDKADVRNDARHSNDRKYTASIKNFLGLTAKAGMTNNILDAASNPVSNGKSRLQREENIDMKLAAVVTQKLPNGNLVIMGRQETRVNFDLREVVLTGIVRPSDITAENTISYEQIGEARFSYGGRGDGMDFQKTTPGQQFFSQIMPF